MRRKVFLAKLRMKKYNKVDIKEEKMGSMKKYWVSIAGVFAVICGLFFINDSASALSMTPMKQAVSLIPGSEYTSRVSIYQQGNGEKKLHYSASIVPLTVNDDNNNYSAVFDKASEYTDIVNWVTLTDGANTVDAGGAVEGYVNFGETVDLIYTINVPTNARGGGHYFAVLARAIPDDNADGSVMISDSIAIASVVYVEVSGDINISGSIRENDFPSFLLNPPITTSFVATNEGNTHSEIIYYMQVFPLFSDEEIYTTEEDPNSVYVLPGTTRYVKQTWDKTPAVGIFKVRQTVYYDSTDTEPSVTEKLVIVCPVWLLFLILFVIIAIIIWIVMRVRSRGKNKRA